MKCHRCGESMTLYVVGDDYCPTCKREMRVREEQDARKVVRFDRFRVAKDLSPFGGAA